MDLTNISKKELLIKCEEFGLKKYKSKNKNELISLIKSKKLIKPPSKKHTNIKFVIKDDNINELAENNIHITDCEIIINIDEQNNIQNVIQNISFIDGPYSIDLLKLFLLYCCKNSFSI
jgi:hypothetical protein